MACRVASQSPKKTSPSFWLCFRRSGRRGLGGRGRSEARRQIGQAKSSAVLSKRHSFKASERNTPAIHCCNEQSLTTRSAQVDPSRGRVCVIIFPMDSVEGVVERITYYNVENGYTVLRFNARGQPDLVTVIGTLPEITPGESLRLSGQWSVHPQHGKQFKAEKCEQVFPATVEGIKKYLESGLIKGVGPVTASRIVKKIGADTLRVVDEEPRKLREVLGIGAKKAAIIELAWQQQKAIKKDR